MGFLEILLLIAVLGLVGGGIYYYNLITSFKRLINFEQQIKANPNDSLVKQYMIQYKKTFFPKKDSILTSRARFYHIIRESSQVSYETKKEFRLFLESQGVILFSGMIAKEDTVEEIEEIE